ncbi:Ephrin-B2a [Desmophyllum pertusum]|uniref:Ephrin-B2a n=1 Tax=Desmophyllum pertusum TaxID=174260 RepID=A0A9W9YUD2_9CNID|nr:Ephrin-B2a [Desmophyllum pertusum]
MVLFCLLVTGTVAEILPSILWNPENPLFKNLGGTARKVNAFDKLSIICPNLVEYPIKRSSSYSKDLLYENVFMVDKKGYDSCNATQGHSILICNDPVTYSYATIVFQRITADINDPKFEQGKEYYFIIIHGGWSDWSECKDGLQTRQCNNPASANGGLACVGQDRRMCTTKAS